MLTNQVVLRLSNDLRKASKKNDAPIWARLADLAVKPTVARRTVNLTKIDQVTKDNDTIIVPGKVLGTGNLSHKVTIASFSVSDTAAKKVIESGSSLMKISELVEKFPTGKGVTIIG